MRRVVAQVVALALGCCAGCKEEESSPPPPVPRSPGLFGDDWEQRDPDCAPPRCVPLVEQLPLPHLGGMALSLMYDPTLVDPIVRWGRCLQTVTDCAAPEEPLADCVAAAATDCPEACRERYASRISGGEEPLGAFVALFLTRGADCYPTPPAQP